MFDYLTEVLDRFGNHGTADLLLADNHLFVKRGDGTFQLITEQAMTLCELLPEGVLLDVSVTCGATILVLNPSGKVLAEFEPEIAAVTV